MIVFGTDTVGMPVTWHPPRRSPHEVFPHGAPRLHSFPYWSFFRSNDYSPQWDLLINSESTRSVLVFFADYVLPSSPSPCTRLSLAQSTTLDPPPHSWWFHLLQLHSSDLKLTLVALPSAPSTVSGCAFRVSNANNVALQKFKTIYKASQVLVCPSSYMPQPDDAGGPSHPCHFSRMHRFSFGDVNTLANLNLRFDAVPTLRVYGYPYGLQNSLCTLRLSCPQEFNPLRLRRNTRYRWLAKPYRTGTCTLQGTPSFAWRSNGRS